MSATTEGEQLERGHLKIEEQPVEDECSSDQVPPRWPPPSDRVGENGRRRPDRPPQWGAALAAILLIGMSVFACYIGVSGLKHALEGTRFE
jgi:hypothetical protein